ncbi:MAG: OmpL47-type beta-barrel domain-containing protein, partial [Promethearchaeota archaeon]
KDTFAPRSSIHFTPHSGIDKVIKSTTFNLTADDGKGSGISVIRYKINNSNWIDYNEPFNLSNYSYGYYLISYQSIDKVNNGEHINIELIELVSDISKPSQPFIPGYHIFLLIGIICIVSIKLIKKQHKL